MFNYKPTDEELKAAALLEDKGWQVIQPKCPLCHGWGTVGKMNEDRVGFYSWSTERCPNGCIQSAVVWHHV